MKLRTAKDITKEHVEWAIEEAYWTVMKRIKGEQFDARDPSISRRDGD